MFKFIKGKKHSGEECLLIWLNNIPISHGEQAELFNVIPEYAGFCNINKAALKYNFLNVYGNAPSVDCSSVGIDHTELAQFIREGMIEFCESTATSIIMAPPPRPLSNRFGIFTARYGDTITHEEMVEKYEHLFKKLYPDN